jgi:hypothetical protein
MRSSFLVALPFVALSTTAQAAPRDAQIVKLAKPALACPFEDGSFSDECAAYKAWSENEPLFADGKGNDTLWSMFGDGDVKQRALAAQKGIDNPKGYFADKGRAAQLLTLAGKETNIDVARSLASYAAYVDADKLGLGKEMRALTKQPLPAFRKSFSAIIAHLQTPTAVAVTQALLEDADREVVRSAISSLSTGGITPGVEPVCAMLAKQMKRTDDLVGDALWSASSSKCPEMGKQVLAELAKRTADPAKVTNAVGVGYSLAASGVCTHTQAPELKKQAFAIGKSLTDARLKDVNTRQSALNVLVSCEQPEATTILTALSKDKDSTIAKRAAENLARLKKK